MQCAVISGELGVMGVKKVVWHVNSCIRLYVYVCVCVNAVN